MDTRNLQIFPNPNNGNFTVISDITGKGNIEILNSLGQVIYSKVLNSENGINENISIPGLPGGIYLIRVISEESGMEQLISIN